MFPLVPLTMGAQEVCQDKVQTAGLSAVSAGQTLRDNNSLIPEELAQRPEKAEDPWMGVTAPGVFKEKRRRDVPLAGESVATCLFKPWVARARPVPQRQTKQWSLNL